MRSGFRDETSSASDWDLGTVSSDFPCCQHRNRTMGSGTFAVTTNGDEEPQSGYETAKSHHYYEILSKSDHQHTQTKSKDPETISTRCVKTNERIQRFVPSPEDSKKGKINRPRDIPEPIARGSAVHRVIHDEVDPPRKAQSQKKAPADEKRQKIKFPSPYRILSSPQSYDDGGSSGSEDIDFSPPAPRMNPPMRSRWANSSRFPATERHQIVAQMRNLPSPRQRVRRLHRERIQHLPRAFLE
uniref:Uncharacterized protein n=1 Tax=Lutzomyia longipalpis TaxID=7200 RepID=A0A1B0GGZ6_LUTLO